MGKKRNTNRITLALPTEAINQKGGSGSVCGRGELMSDIDELESVHSSLTGADFGDSDNENSEFANLIDSFGDQMENAQDKRVNIRVKAMDNILLVLHKNYVPENVDKWRTTLVEIIEKNMKRTFDEAIRMCSLAALVSLQLGVDIDEEIGSIVELMCQICADNSANENIRASAAQAIGLCVYMSVESRVHLSNSLQTLKNVWSGMKPAGTSGTSLFSSSLASWTLLLKRFDPSFIELQIAGLQSKLCDFLESTTVEARISAGESLATIFEIAVKYLDDDFQFENQIHIEKLLAELALDSSKNRAKRDKKLQRLTFRQISDVVCHSGRGPVFVVRFNKRETLIVEGCHAKLLYDLLCQLLRSDLNRHLTKNEVIRDLFDLGPVLDESELQKPTKAQKNERMSQLEELQKQRNISRSKGRAKKMGHKHDFGDDE